MIAKQADIKRFEVYLVDVTAAVDPMIGWLGRMMAAQKNWVKPTEAILAEGKTQNLRPFLILSPDEMNRHIVTVIAAPMTAKGRAYPTRPPCVFQDKEGQIALDQLRTIYKVRLRKRLGSIDAATQQRVLETLAEMFAA